jgi:hypothetical protein
MYAMVGFGALPDDVRAAAQAVMPPCYTNTFDVCLDDDKRTAPECAKYEPMHVAFDHDHDAAKAMIDALEYCEHGTERLLIAGAVGGMLGLLLGAAIAA